MPGPAVSTSRPFSMSLLAISLLVQPSLTSMPIMSPRPRVAPKQGRSRASIWLRRYVPLAWTSSRNASVRVSCTTRPAAAHTGLAPKVVAWVPGPSTSRHFSLARMPLMGSPPAIPLAKDTTSGTMPYCWKAKRLPVRPTPVWTSSISSSQSRSAQSLATAFT